MRTQQYVDEQMKHFRELLTSDVIPNAEDRAYLLRIIRLELWGAHMDGINEHMAKIHTQNTHAVQDEMKHWDYLNRKDEGEC